MPVEVLTECRICKSKDLIDIINLGEQGLASVFPKRREDEIPVAPLILSKCSHCHLVQLKHTISGSEMYKNMMYGYRSGLNATMPAHLRALVKETVGMLKDGILQDGDVVVDIGSNDSTLLKSYESLEHKCAGLRRFGVDPTGAQFKAYYPEDVQLIPDFFSKSVLPSGLRAKVVTSIAMYYDLPDPQQFMNDVRDILDPEEGIWVMEQSYLPTMLERNSFDTICHEHLEYYGLTQIEYMAKASGLEILRVSLNECNGGSFRVALCHRGSAIYARNAGAQGQIWYAEKEALIRAEDPFNSNLIEETPYEDFMERCDTQRNLLQNLLKQIRAQGKTVYLYGASTKGNTLLQYYGIDHTLIQGAAERNPDKYGSFTPVTHIPILSEAEVRAAKPDFMLVLPWHFKEEFLQREQEYLNGGGQFIFPLPEIAVVSATPIALVTGIRGQIGTYLSEYLAKRGYAVYGTSQSALHSTPPPHVKAILNGDINDIVAVLKPAEVYHLAAQTSSEMSQNDCVGTLRDNGILVAEILKAVAASAPRAKVFIANSTELFKGNPVKSGTGKGAYINEENMESLFHPRTPYGIAKLAAYWTARYFRDSHAHCLKVATGILTTTDSRYRRDGFVLKKIMTHAWKWARADPSNPLPTAQLGSLDVSRDWIHAKDVARAAWEILQVANESCSDYIIATGVTTPLRAVIELALIKVKVPFIWETPHQCCDLNTGAVIFEGSPSQTSARAYEINDGSAIYDNKKLRTQTQWHTHLYTIDDILQDILESLEDQK